MITRTFQLGDLIGQRDELLGESVEQPEVLDLLFDLRSLGGGNALGAFLAPQSALQHIVGSRLDRFTSAVGLEELATQGAATHVVDPLDLNQNRVPLRTEVVKYIRHVSLYLQRYNSATQKMRPAVGGRHSGYFFVMHPRCSALADPGSANASSSVPAPAFTVISGNGEGSME